MRTLEPVTIDPRRHDAVLFDLDAVVTAEGSAFDSTVRLVRQLHEIGVDTAVFSSDGGPDLLASAASIGPSACTANRSPTYARSPCGPVTVGCPSCPMRYRPSAWRLA